MPQADAGPADGDPDAGVRPGPAGDPSRDADGPGPGPESKRRRMDDEAAAAWAGGGYSDAGRTGPGGRTPAHGDGTPVFADRTPRYADADAHAPNEGRRGP